jgi:hypothetical protein
MARVHTAGFESGKPHGTPAYDGESNGATTGTGIDHTMVGTVTYQTTTARNNGRAMQCDPGANYTQIRDYTHTDGQPTWARFYLRFTSNPNAINTIWLWRINALTAGELRIETNGTMTLRNSAGTVVATSATLSTGTWYRVETKIVVNAGTGTGELELLIDGVLVGGSTSTSTGTALSPVTHRLGHCTTNDTVNTVYIDDLAINDHTGTDQAGYPGPGNVALLVPASDNTKGTGWVAGAGGATLYPAVDNVPPVGVVTGSATDTSQIKNVTSTTNSVYSGNCVVGAFAGMTLGSKVTLAQGLARVSCDSATGTNLMEIESFTPAIAAVQIDAELGTIAANETDATPGWKTGRTLVTYNPTLDYVTSPVVGVRKITSATRAHMADQIGLLIEWTDATLPEINYAGNQPAPNGGQRG